MDVVEADVSEVGTTKIDVAYKTLPFVYAYCKIGGHLDKLCPTKHQQTRLEIDQQLVEEERKLSKALDEEGFILVNKRGSPSKAKVWSPRRLIHRSTKNSCRLQLEDQRRRVNIGEDTGLSTSRLSGTRCKASSPINVEGMQVRGRGSILPRTPSPKTIHLEFGYNQSRNLDPHWRNQSKMKDFKLNKEVGPNRRRRIEEMVDQLSIQGGNGRDFNNDASNEKDFFAMAIGPSCNPTRELDKGKGILKLIDTNVEGLLN